MPKKIKFEFYSFKNNYFLLLSTLFIIYDKISAYLIKQ